MAEPLAHAAFDTTAAERADVACRAAELLPTVRRQRRLAVVLALAIATPLTLALMRWRSPDGDWLIQVGITALVALVVGMLAPAQVRRSYRRAVHKMALDAYGDGPLPFAVDMHADHVVGHSKQHSLTVPWREVRSVRDIGGDVEIASSSAMMVVRARAFASADERDRFRQLAERLAAAAAPAEPKPRASSPAM